MFKGKKSRIILACVAIVLVLGTTAFAKQATETISVMYDNIKILIDGEEYTAKDANGNVIEPFIYNGTTYLPVRGIANAFDVEVNWEQENNTVELDDNKFDWLSEMSCVNIEANNCKSAFSLYDDGNEHAALKFSFDEEYTLYTECENIDVTQRITYKLSNKYKKFYATFKRLTEHTFNGAYIKIYGDNEKLLYQSYSLRRYNFDDGEIETTIDIEVDVSNEDYITVEAVSTNDTQGNLTGNFIENSSNIILQNARLSYK